MIEQSHKILGCVTKYTAGLAMLFLLGAMLVTTADVILRKLDGAGIYGTIDLIQLMVLSAAYLSIPQTFMSGSHVAVSIITDRLSQRPAALFQLIGALLSCCFMFAIVIFSFAQAKMQHEYGDISMTLGLPMIYYWVPLVIGSALSVLVALHLGITSFYSLITRRDVLSRYKQ
ncbi:TRAP transporter small permease [Kiloniella laminariae]|uniref:TRAP transporter small permease n=1 Tax=Kiloniella laminariae TaxID=454162 RepID=UPI0003621696|nr:TRAP transporter small permease [Kiloniella laminariae]